MFYIGINEITSAIYGLKIERTHNNGRLSNLNI